MTSIWASIVASGPASADTHVFQFARLVRERTEVKGGGEPPKTPLGMEESMIVQVISVGRW